LIATANSKTSPPSVAAREAVERGSDALPHLLRLARYERGHPHCRGEHVVPELIGAGEPLHERHGSHARIRQTLLTERLGERFVIGEPEEIRSPRKIGRRHGSRLSHRIEEYPDQPVLGGMSPCRQDDPAAGTEHARELGDGALGTRQVHDHQVPDDCVEDASANGSSCASARRKSSPG